MSFEEEKLSFLALNTQESWEKGLPIRVQISDEGIRIAEDMKYKIFLMVSNEYFPADLEVKDYAVGLCNLIYILDKKGTVWICDPQQKKFERICCISNYIKNPQKIDIIKDTVYIVDGVEEKGYRIFAFALINWQLRWCVNTGFHAFGQETDGKERFYDYVLESDGKWRFYVLDTKERKVLIFSRRACQINEIVLETQMDLDLDLYGLAVSRDGIIYSYDKNLNRLICVNTEKEEKNNKGEENIIDIISFQLDGFGGLAFGTGENIYIASDTVLYRYNLKNKEISKINDYNRKILGLESDARGNLFVRGESEFSVLELQPVLARQNESLLPGGFYYTKAFDSTKNGNEWHKLVLDAEIPENTQIRVSYLIADNNELDNQLDNYRAKRLSAQGLENQISELRWSSPIVNPVDALFLNYENKTDINLEGRYLWLRIELTGTETTSPLLRSIRVFSPRMSYLRYLPAVYQEDENSRYFLERFLALFETMFSKLEYDIDHVTKYFDPFAVPTEFLNSLASWMGIAVDDNWPEEKLRQFIAKAMDLYRKRGTCSGIKEMIELYIGIKPVIVENFKLDCMNEDLKKQLYGRLYGNDSNRFTVILNPIKPKEKHCFVVRELLNNELATIQHILDSEKPAHTEAALVLLKPWIYLDQHTYLGINTCLSKPSFTLDLGLFMPQDTVLTDSESAGQIERRSRLGQDTILT